MFFNLKQMFSSNGLALSTERSAVRHNRILHYCYHQRTLVTRELMLQQTVTQELHKQSSR